MAILLQLQARGELRAEDLARRFEVSVRTVYRDVHALSEGGVPVVATPGKGYRLMDGYFLPPLGFTADEAALLVLGADFVRERVDPELRRAADDALAKLATVLPPERREAVARWRRELLFPHLGPDVDPPWLARLRAAVQERRVLRLLYHALRRAGPEPRVVEPVSLVHFSESWFLSAYCRLRRAMRLFRLDRIDRLEELDERFAPAARHAIDPDGDARWGRFAEARVRFDPAVERWVRERQPYFFLREEAAAGGPVFVYALRDERELLPWLLAWGAEVVVLSPPDLRVRLAAEARAILARHADAADPAQSPTTSRPPATTVSAGAV